MTTLCVQGGIPLRGNVRIQGSKNAALPVLAATLLCGATSYIGNCPRIADVQNMVELLRSLGCAVKRERDSYVIDSRNSCYGRMPQEAIVRMRSSLCLLGAMLARFGEVEMEYPGGCVIGARPIDIHLDALGQMGVVFTENEGRLRGYAAHLRGAEITLPFPSVGATENIILAAVMADGDTLLKGAAMEPEVETLCRYLIACGAQIKGIGGSVLRVKGKSSLRGTAFEIPADRIVAGTYLYACVGTGGNVYLEDAPCSQMEAVIRSAEQMGACCQAIYTSDSESVLEKRSQKSGLYVQGPQKILPIPDLRTEVYPGFPTDLQSMALTVLTRAKGDSRVQETIFENRFRVVEELKKMGADIRVQSSSCVLVKGVEELHAASLEARELRGGAALVIAGLMAEGSSQIDGYGFIARGYENIGRDLRDLGARVTSV